MDMTTETPAVDIVAVARRNIFYFIGAATFKVSADKEAAAKCAEVLTDEITRLRAENAELQEIQEAQARTIQRRQGDIEAQTQTILNLQRKLDEAVSKAAQIAGDAFWNLPIPKQWDRDKQEYSDWCARQSKFVREKIVELTSIRGEA
jgi:hypothetical protein